MKINKEIDFIKLLGWTVASKMIYMLKRLKEGRTYDELHSELVDGGLMKQKSFIGLWKKVQLLKKDVKFI